MCGEEAGRAAVTGSSNFTAQQGGKTSASPRHVCHHSCSAGDARRRCLQKGKVACLAGRGGVAGWLRLGQEGGRQQVQSSLSEDLDAFPAA